MCFLCNGLTCTQYVVAITKSSSGKSMRHLLLDMIGQWQSAHDLLSLLGTGL